MRDAEETPPPSESSSGNTDPKPLAENTEVITPTISQSSTEATISSLVDNPIEEPSTHFPVTEFSGVTISTNDSNDQSAEQNNSASTPKDTFDGPEQSHQGDIAEDSEHEASEDIFDRKHAEQNNSASTPNDTFDGPEQSHQGDIAEDSEQGASEDIFDRQHAEQNNSASTPKDTFDGPEQSHQEDIAEDSEQGASEYIFDRQHAEHNNSASTPKDTFDGPEQSHQGDIAEDSEQGASEDIFDRQHAEHNNSASTPKDTFDGPEQSHQGDIAEDSEQGASEDIIDRQHAEQNNSASTPEDTFDGPEQSHQGDIAEDSEQGASADIFDRQQDGASTVTASIDVDDLIKLSTSSSETKELQIDPTGTISDSPPTNVTIENPASTPEDGDHVTEEKVIIEDIFSRKQDGGSTVVAGGDVDNQMELLASSSENAEFQNDNKELKIDEMSQTKSKHVAVGAFELPTTTEKIVAAKRGVIDTASPFESVKQAVSKFGGIVDWKAHRSLTVERRKQVEEELEKAHEEIPVYRRRSEAAEKAKIQVLQELDSTKRLIEELKLNLERAQTEERQARQDSELARLRVEELEQGIAEDASVAAKAQLEVAKARYTSAITEYRSVKTELEELRSEYTSLVTEKFEAMKKAEEAVAASKQVERTVEDLTIELISTKESLETAHAAHMEAEEHRIGTVMARDQDFLNWEKELKQAEAELEQLNQKILCAKDLKSKLSEASTLLVDLKAELSAYMESKSNKEREEAAMSIEEREQKQKKTHNEIQEAVASAKKELEEVNLNIEKAIAEVNYLKVAATSLRSELDQEKSSLASLRQREGMASITVASLEAELDKTRTETGFVLMREKEGREQITVMPKKLQLAAEEANQANLRAQEARVELRRVKEEAERAKAGASTMQSRLLAAQKEIEAARASERLAIAAIKALQESESARSKSNNEVDTSTTVTLSVEEYYHLSKQAHLAEEEANMRVASANSEIEVAKDSELKTLEKLNEVNKEMATRRESLKIAMDKAEKARERKLGVEQELRKWRAEHGQQRKAGGGVANQNISQSVSLDRSKERSIFDQSHSAPIPVNYFSNPKSFFHSHNESAGSSPDTKAGRKKKKSFLPRFLMFFARRKAHN